MASKKKPAKKVARRKRCKHCGELPAKKCESLGCKNDSDFHEFCPYAEDVGGEQRCADYCLECHNNACMDV